MENSKELKIELLVRTKCRGIKPKAQLDECFYLLGKCLPCEILKEVNILNICRPMEWVEVAEGKRGKRFKDGKKRTLKMQLLDAEECRAFLKKHSHATGRKTNNVAFIQTFVKNKSFRSHIAFHTSDMTEWLYSWALVEGEDNFKFCPLKQKPSPMTTELEEAAKILAEKENANSSSSDAENLETLPILEPNDSDSHNISVHNTEAETMESDILTDSESQHESSTSDTPQGVDHNIFVEKPKTSQENRSAPKKIQAKRTRLIRPRLAKTAANRLLKNKPSIGRNPQTCRLCSQLFKRSYLLKCNSCSQFFHYPKCTTKKNFKDSEINKFTCLICEKRK